MDDQDQIEATAARVKANVDSTVAPDIQDDTVGSVNAESDTTASGIMKSTEVEGAINLDQTFDEVVVIICHGCKETNKSAVKITNLNISLLETARTGTTAAASTITGFGPPNIPSVLKRIDQYVNQQHPGTPVTLKDVYDVVVTHTGDTHHKTEAFFAEDSEFVFLTPTSDAVIAGHFEIHEAQLFGTGCRLRHSGIFALDQDGQVKDITFELGLAPNTQVQQYKSKKKNCNDNIIKSKTSGMVQQLVNITRTEMTKVETQIRKLNSHKTNTLLSPADIVLAEKRINILTQLLRRYEGDLQFLLYKLQPYGYIQSGSHVKHIPGIPMDEPDITVRLSDILNHSYFSHTPNKKYLVILHVCKVSCDYSPTQGALKRTDSYQTETLKRGSFDEGRGLTYEPHKKFHKVSPGGGNLNKRKSGSKKKKARTRAVTRTKRNRTKKRGTRNNNNTNKRRKNK